MELLSGTGLRRRWELPEKFLSPVAGQPDLEDRAAVRGVGRRGIAAVDSGDTCHHGQADPGSRRSCGCAIRLRARTARRAGRRAPRQSRAVVADLDLDRASPLAIVVSTGVPSGVWSIALRSRLAKLPDLVLVAANRHVLGGIEAELPGPVTSPSHQRCIRRRPRRDRPGGNTGSGSSPSRARVRDRRPGLPSGPIRFDPRRSPGLPPRLAVSRRGDRAPRSRGSGRGSAAHARRRRGTGASVPRFPPAGGPSPRSGGASCWRGSRAGRFPSSGPSSTRRERSPAAISPCRLISSAPGASARSRSSTRRGRPGRSAPRR